MAVTILILAAIVVVGLLLNLPQLGRSRLWLATVTPLASIIGSGFLVAAPLLARVAGPYAVVVMTALCAAAYVIGAAIRHNILAVEPALAGARPLPRAIRVMERGGELILALSYLISICFYIQLMSSFALDGAGVRDPQAGRIFSTVVIGFLGALGLLRGFGRLQALEEHAVVMKLAVIAGLLAGLAVFDIGGAGGPSLAVPVIDAHAVRVGLGALLIIQGFETSRYLGHVYSPEERVRSMRYAQLIASAIYVVFMLLAVDFLDPAQPADETAIIHYSEKIAPILPVFLILGAVAAQFSAAIADFVGGAGILVEALPVRERLVYPGIAAAAIGLTWSLNVFEVLTLASRGFAAYYLIQCVEALIVAWPERSRPRLAVFAAGALVSAATLVFGLPTA